MRKELGIAIGTTLALGFAGCASQPRPIIEPGPEFHPTPFSSLVLPEDVTPLNGSGYTNVGHQDRFLEAAGRMPVKLSVSPSGLENLNNLLTDRGFIGSIDHFETTFSGLPECTGHTKGHRDNDMNEFRMVVSPQVLIAARVLPRFEGQDLNDPQVRVAFYAEASSQFAFWGAHEKSHEYHTENKIDHEQAESEAVSLEHLVGAEHLFLFLSDPDASDIAVFCPGCVDGGEIDYNILWSSISQTAESYCEDSFSLYREEQEEIVTAKP